MRIINCVGGYGDILFCEPIFRRFWNSDGIKPVVVIHAHQMWIKDYIDSATFTSKCPSAFSTGSNFHNTKFINLRYANQILRGYGPDDHHDLENMMLDKYRLLGLSDDLWKTLEIKLLKSDAIILNPSTNIPLHERHILLNNNSQVGKIEIPLEQFFSHTPVSKIIYMHEIIGVNLIDWSESIRMAKENHHISTSTFFIMQAIKNKYPEWNAPCYIYPRPNVDGLRGISQLKPDFNLIRVLK